MFLFVFASTKSLQPVPVFYAPEIETDEEGSGKREMRGRRKGVMMENEGRREKEGERVEERVWTKKRREKE